MIQTTKETCEIILKHNSIVLFSKDSNAECKHKITLMPGKHIQPWIGITYRTSKTYIDPKNPHLRLADKKETQEFYRLKSEENESVDFKIHD